MLDKYITLKAVAEEALARLPETNVARLQHFAPLVWHGSAVTVVDAPTPSAARKLCSVCVNASLALVYFSRQEGEFPHFCKTYECRYWASYMFIAMRPFLAREMPADELCNIETFFEGFEIRGWELDGEEVTAPDHFIVAGQRVVRMNARVVFRYILERVIAGNGHFTYDEAHLDALCDRFGTMHNFDAKRIADDLSVPLL
jgi:hypothetical protein